VRGRRTVTGKDVDATLPLESLAVHVTVVLTHRALSGEGVQVTGRDPSTSSTAVGAV
jgi:hypothetical protein